jgi:YidC/Oxa1 family membrane protein insertase
MNDNRNLFLAIALSVVVLVLWNVFFGIPEAQRQRQIAQTQQQQTSAPPQPGTSTAGAPSPQVGATGAPQSGTAPAPAVAAAGEDRAAVIARSPRIAIETPALSGSIALKGGRIDDLKLKNYRETVDPKSSNITLFSPSGAPEPFYAEFGFVGQPGAAIKLPGPDTLWTASGDKLTPTSPLKLTWSNGEGLTFIRNIAVDENYMFTVRDEVQNSGTAPVNLFPYALVSRHGTPVTLGFYILHEGLIGVLGEAGLQEITYSTLEKEGTRTWKATGGFLGFTDKYWAATLIPDQAENYTGRISMQPGARKTYQSDVLLDQKTIAPGQSISVETRLFAGAKETALVDNYEEKLGIKRFDLLIDWGWFYFITKPLFWAIDYSYKLFGNFGIAILVVTVLIKLLFFPLANKSYASMAKMKAVQPQMKELQERYKDDRMKMQQELMELYKREKINPLAGCWPVLIQIPVFFALYKVLFVTIEMRHAPFFGWIQDLSAPDPTSIFNLFGLLPFAVPSFLMIGAWPIIMGITMFIQMKMNPEPTDPTQKMIFSWMPVFFTFLLASFPAGLVIYWSWNNLLSVTQQYFIMRKHGVKVELWDNLRGMFRKGTAAG